jgi:hypothetical protein
LVCRHVRRVAQLEAVASADEDAVLLRSLLLNLLLLTSLM